MEEILETMDNIRNQTRKKLDNVYQLILITKRRRRLRELKKIKDQKRAAQLAEQSASHNTDDASATHNSKNSPSKEKTDTQKENLGRRLNRMRGYRNDSFNFDRALQLENPQYYNFGRIPSEEENFQALIDPNFVRASV